MTIDAQAFMMVDTVKGILLDRLDYEVNLVLDDKFLTQEQRMSAFRLYCRIRADYVSYVTSFHAIKTPNFLLDMAQIANDTLSANLDKAWIYAYDGKLGPKNQIQWLSEREIEKANF